MVTNVKVKNILPTYIASPDLLINMYISVTCTVGTSCEHCCVLKCLCLLQYQSITIVPLLSRYSTVLDWVLLSQTLRLPVTTSINTNKNYNSNILFKYFI